jgi:hypothetical protein
MRLLFLCHEETDYVEAQIYLALCEELGPDNVVDFPYKLSYHGQVHRYPSIYRTDPGTTATGSWKDGDVPMGETSPLSWMRAQPSREWSFDEVIRGIKDGSFDAVVLTSPRTTNSRVLEQIFAEVGRGAISKLAMIDGEDYDAIRWDLAQRFSPDVYFKRELVASPTDLYPAQRQALQDRVRVVPLPLTPVEIRPRQPADAFELDVAMPGGGNIPGGAGQYEEAIRRVTNKVYVGYGSPDRYGRMLASARIVVAPRGHSQDSLRSWEALAVQGPMFVIHRHSLIRPYPFLDGIHAVHFDGPADLESILRSYLTNENESLRATVAAQGFAHLVKYHSLGPRARYVLQEIAKG